MPFIELPPKKPGGPNERVEDVKSMVIVGANGTGKSRLGAWIEKAVGANTHRITAQRALSIPSVVQPRPYEQAESALLYGNYDPGQKPEQRVAAKFGNRWGDEPYTRLLNDFENVLALLFADEAKRNRDYTRGALKSVPMNGPPKRKLDLRGEIWASVMPQRLLTIGDDKLEAKTEKGNPYEGRHMSDGERVSVYLMGQALCAPEGAVVIIDEPEIHLHRAIQGMLWDKIEAARPGCALVYITHDLDFAATRVGAKKIWLKEYNGKDWVWEEIVSGPSLPDALLFQVLGSRRPLLFVEGDKSSYDEAVYTALYPNDLVVPRGSGDKVKEATKAMLALPAFHHLKVRGLVDRDRRGDEEVSALRDAGLVVADVAEVEKLLCLPEALEAVAEHLNCPDVPAAQAATDGVVLAELAKTTEQQALARALDEIQFRLNGFGPKIGKSDPAKLEADLQG